jgi:uncharacterized protein YjbJ (UPF0337 family)
LSRPVLGFNCHWFASDNPKTVLEDNLMDGLWDTIAGKWKQFVGSVRQEWADLTDDDLEYIGGEKDKLVGKIQERYGMTKMEAEGQVSDWMKRQERERNY